MAIVSAVFAGVLLVLSAISLHNSSYSLDQHYGITYELLILMTATMLVTFIASASLTCKPLCSRSNSTRQGTVHYTSNQLPIYYNPNSANPPSYQEVACPPAYPPAYTQTIPSVGVESYSQNQVAATNHCDPNNQPTIQALQLQLAELEPDWVPL